jgi:hypothetical protein
MATPKKLKAEYQSSFPQSSRLTPGSFAFLAPSLDLRYGALANPLSGGRACCEVLAPLADDPASLRLFLRALGIDAECVLPFPSGIELGGELYADQGWVVFSWIGPRALTLNENFGDRAHRRTCACAFLLALIDGRVTQLLVDWSFAEGMGLPIERNVFGGFRGLERLRRYSSLLCGLRGKNFPFFFSDEGGVGLASLSSEPLHRLLWLTLLAKLTTPIRIGDIAVEDYRVVHLAHSRNPAVDLHAPAMSSRRGRRAKDGAPSLHDAWRGILSPSERRKFIGAYWDEALDALPEGELRSYLSERYA